MRLIFCIILLILLTSLVSSETTFFDNPDDTFIISNSFTTAGESIITGGYALNSEAGCNYKWNCTKWSKCSVSEEQTRNCINIGTCSNKYNSPKIKQNCTYIPEITGRIIWEKIKDNNQLLINFIFIFVILLLAFYLEKRYLKNLIKKLHRKVL